MSWGATAGALAIAFAVASLLPSEPSANLGPRHSHHRVRHRRDRIGNSASGERGEGCDGWRWVREVPPIARSGEEKEDEWGRRRRRWVDLEIPWVAVGDGFF